MLNTSWSWSGEPRENAVERGNRQFNVVILEKTQNCGGVPGSAEP